MSNIKKNPVKDITLEPDKVYKTPKYVWNDGVEYDIIINGLKQVVLKPSCSFAGIHGSFNKTYSYIICVPDKSVSGYKNLDSGLKYVCSNIKRCITNRLEKQGEKLQEELEITRLYVNCDFNVTVYPDVSKVVRHYADEHYADENEYIWIFQITVNILAEIHEY